MTNQDELLEKASDGPGDLHFFCDDMKCGANKFYKQGFKAGYLMAKEQDKAEIEKLKEKLELAMFCIIEIRGYSNNSKDRMLAQNALDDINELDKEWTTG